jgi:nicotinamide phosphoribosyltransferase
MSKTIYPATLLCDFYKVSHLKQYPEGTEYVYSNWTPRGSRVKGVDKVVAFGFQAFIKQYLIEYFNEHFFNRDINEVVKEYNRVIKYALGVNEPDASHIISLHKLGYLPIKIKAIEEGTLVPLRVPMLTIENTIPEFFWVTNYLETIMSCQLWIPSTSATLALQYKKILDKYAIETIGDTGFVPFQGHDFSMRGMGSLESASSSGAGHLLSFVGSDTIPAISFLEEYYNANIENELVACSVPASEHSVMCAYGENEFESYKRLITEVHPNGIVSIVSDTWDLWKVLTDVISKLKNKILQRDGKVVIRPDSGIPEDIICGTAKIVDMETDTYVKTLDDAKRYMKSILEQEVSDETPHGEHGYTENTGIFKFNDKYYRLKIDIEYNRHDKQYYYIDGVSIASCEETTLTLEEKGVIEILWDIFGGTISEKGYKVLDSHIGAIYGDAITLERCEIICSRLKEKGFASTNMVFGIGSFTYQYNTRDTFGYALKSTHVVINGEERNIYKDPVTDTDKLKKSLTGRVAVVRNKKGDLVAIDNLTIEESNSKSDNVLTDVFIDGKIIREINLSEIRKNLGK